MRLALPILVLALTACQPDRHALAKAVIARHCAACHSVAGIGSATGRTGPVLDRIGSQQIIGGRLTNSRENMIAWITHAHTIAPGGAMPDIPLSRHEAGAVADYFYALDSTHE